MKKSFREFHFFIEKLSLILGFESKEHTHEMSELDHINLEKWPDNSTIGLMTIENGAIEIQKMQGYPAKLNLRYLSLQKK